MLTSYTGIEISETREYEYLNETDRNWVKTIDKTAPKTSLLIGQIVVDRRRILHVIGGDLKFFLATVNFFRSL